MLKSMLEQQFLTTFNTITNNLTTNSIKNKNNNNLLIDYINGTYQGYLTIINQPDGLGTIIDDQFNYIFCSNWNKGKIDGNTFIKLSNQICIWGLWANNMPKKYCCVKIGLYLIIIPYWDYNKLKRPKKCLIYHQGKGKIYLTTIQRYPQGNKSKRQYSIVIQKVISIKQKTISQAAILINIAIQEYQLDIQSYLYYLADQLEVLKIYKFNNNLFITTNILEIVNRNQIKLGILLDCKKFGIKSVGAYSVKNMEGIIRNNNNNNEINNTRQLTYDNFPRLNGLGLAKTMQSQIIIGVFKDDMLIRQLNSQQNIQKIRNNTKNYARNINGSVVKQILQHQHMKSINYQHNYLYFPQIKNIVSKSIQMHKYVQMFQRLSYQSQNQNNRQINQSINNQHIHNNKYQNNQQLIKKIITNQSSGSIIDQFPQLKVNLNKQIYREQNSSNNNSNNNNGSNIQINSGLTFNNNTNNIVNNNASFNDSNISYNKKPGHILSRSSRIGTQKSQKQIYGDIITRDKVKISPRKSPIHQINPKLFKKLSPSRSPLKTTDYKWRK